MRTKFNSENIEALVKFIHTLERFEVCRDNGVRLSIDSVTNIRGIVQVVSNMPVAYCSIDEDVYAFLRGLL